MESLLLIEGQDLSEETLGSISLNSSKQLVIGSVIGFGVMLHLNATTFENHNEALSAFAQAPGVTRVVTLVLKPT